MGVDTHGLEAIRNSAENLAGDNPQRTFIKTLNGWIWQNIGRKIVASYPTDTTELYTFLQDSTEHYKVLITYVDNTKEQFLSAERTL